MRKLGLVTVCGLVVALTGCAAGSSNSKAAMQGPSSYDEVDWAKMTLITNDAQRRGYKVVWVHPPQKPRAVAAPDRGTP